MSWSFPVAGSGVTNPKPRGLVCTRPTSRFILSGSPYRLPPNLHQRPGGDQRLQLALERGTLIPRHPQRLLQLAGCRRVVDPLPYPIE